MTAFRHRRAISRWLRGNVLRRILSFSGPARFRDMTKQGAPHAHLHFTVHTQCTQRSDETAWCTYTTRCTYECTAWCISHGVRTSLKNGEASLATSNAKYLACSANSVSSLPRVTEGCGPFFQSEVAQTS